MTWELCQPAEFRDNNAIIKQLEEIAKHSDSTTNAKAYKAFNGLSTKQKKIMISRIQILDASLDIESVKQKSLNELKLSTPPEKLVPFYERLEGWWFSKSIENLFQGGQNISFNELQSKIYDIQDQFKSDNLPIDFMEKIHVEDKDAEEDDRIFVLQLRLISLGKALIKNAISDYYRAFEQRSKWIREGLINPNEESRYDAELIDYWEPKFALMRDELESNADSSEHHYRKTGRSFYQNFYINACPQKYIRSRVTNEFLARGSSHMLSDKKRIGWHPNYEENLEK